MPTTTYLDPDMQVWALQTRTDVAGSDVEDSSAAEGRLVWRMYTEGTVGADSYEVTAAGGSMTVVVGSGTAFTDMAVVSGDTAALGNYGVLLEPASQNVTVPAADLSNPRIDQIYLVVVDDPGTMVKARIGYRQGDAAGTPSAPGPDSGWEGSLLLASIAVGTGVTEIVQGNVTDNRVKAAPQPTVLGGWEVDGEVKVATFTLNATRQIAATLPLTIPTDWASWKCYAIATLAYRVMDAVGEDGSIILFIEIDGVEVNNQSVIRVDDFTSAGSVNHSGAISGRRTGMTTTGVRNINLKGELTANTSNPLRDIHLYARAVRTS